MVNSGAFDMSEFPSLGQRTNHNFQQQFRPQQQGLHSGMPPVVQSEFAMQSEDFPALPGAAPASSNAGDSTASSSGLGGAFSTIRHGTSGLDSGLTSGMESVLGMGGKEHDDLVGSGLRSSGNSGMPAERAERYGLMGLLSVIRMTDQDLNTLALGTDLTTLGLNLNSSDCLYATFASPWADSPAQRDPEFTLPQCYYMQPPALKTGGVLPHLCGPCAPDCQFRVQLTLETLFYIFYNMPRDTLQAYAATELYNRDWRYHKDLKLWFTRASRQGAQDNQKGQYIYFDINEWKKKMFHGAGAGGTGTGVSEAGEGDGDAHPEVDKSILV
ncbi:MAG: hypothetical protein SGPRY_004220 [Prymnesium sp.]